ncbi:MAG: prolyl oligopeptidase family serine peptidase [Bdellovibrionaceae bacterium]|nr:prolyl oligopeptidase family serine peptidase [Pseudobdellovibrionaceae bacterium]
MTIKTLGLIFIFLCVGPLNAQTRLTKLVPLNVNPNTITVSGVSAGGFMAVQMHVALSSVFKGAASVAGGVYWCAQGNAMTAQMNCMRSPSVLNVDTFLGKAKSDEAANKIEKLENIKRSRVFIFAAKNDTIVHPGNSDKLYEFYSKLTPKANIKYKSDVPSGHSWITNRYGTRCGTQTSPWITNCNYDLAGDILTFFYGKLNSPKSTVPDMKRQMFTFDQNEFQTRTSSLFPTGFIYIPKSCQAAPRGGACHLHVNFHGCQMGPNYLNDQYVSNTGLNEWAEINNIIVLYPQAANSVFSNPYGCWDWFGYTGSDYVNKNGPQIIAIQKMVYRILGKY